MDDNECGRKPCDHDEMHPSGSIWVKPTPTEKKPTPALKRTYCRKCGRIRYKGSATARKIGFYINILKEIQRKIDVLRRRKITRSRLTSVQIRLIVKELESDDDFLDSFSNNRHNQWAHFKYAVKRHCEISEELLDSIYRDFKG